MMVLRSLLGVGVLSLSTHALAQDPIPFESEIRAYEQMDVVSPPPRNPVVFVGSSSIRSWNRLESDFPDYPALNRGFGGSTMADLNYYFDRIVEPYKPRLVVVYEGDNDLANGLSASRVFADYEEFVGLMKVRLPGSAFALMSVKPSPSRSGLIPEMRELNSLLETLADSQGGYYFDVFSAMVDASGAPFPQLFLDDRLHLNTAGYRLWRQTLTPQLDAWSSERRRRLRFRVFEIRNGALVLEWDPFAPLESAARITGPWSPVNTPTTGRHEEVLDQGRQYFRLR